MDGRNESVPPDVADPGSWRSPVEGPLYDPNLASYYSTGERPDARHEMRDTPQTAASAEALDALFAVPTPEDATNRRSGSERRTSPEQEHIITGARQERGSLLNRLLGRLKEVGADVADAALAGAEMAIQTDGLAAEGWTGAVARRAAKRAPGKGIRRTLQATAAFLTHSRAGRELEGYLDATALSLIAKARTRLAPTVGRHD